MKLEDFLPSQEIYAGAEKLDVGDTDAKDSSFEKMCVDFKINRLNSLPSFINPDSSIPFASNIVPLSFDNTQCLIDNLIPTKEDGRSIIRDHIRSNHNFENDHSAKCEPKLADSSSTNVSESTEKKKIILMMKES